jgi:hypothetical protein
VAFISGVQKKQSGWDELLTTRFVASSITPMFSCIGTIANVSASDGAKIDTPKMA